MLYEVVLFENLAASIFALFALFLDNFRPKFKDKENIQIIGYIIFLLMETLGSILMEDKLERRKILYTSDILYKVSILGMILFSIITMWKVAKFMNKDKAYRNIAVILLGLNLVIAIYFI